MGPLVTNPLEWRLEAEGSPQITNLIGEQSFSLTHQELITALATRPRQMAFTVQEGRKSAGVIGSPLGPHRQILHEVTWPDIARDAPRPSDILSAIAKRQEWMV